MRNSDLKDSVFYFFTHTLLQTQNPGLMNGRFYSTMVHLVLGEISGPHVFDGLARLTNSMNGVTHVLEMEKSPLGATSPLVWTWNDPQSLVKDLLTSR
jgi:hypothetical protein